MVSCVSVLSKPKGRKPLIKSKLFPHFKALFATKCISFDHTMNFSMVKAVLIPNIVKALVPFEKQGMVNSLVKEKRIMMPTFAQGSPEILGQMTLHLVPYVGLGNALDLGVGDDGGATSRKTLQSSSNLVSRCFPFFRMLIGDVTSNAL